MGVVAGGDMTHGRIPAWRVCSNTNLTLTVASLSQTSLNPNFCPNLTWRNVLSHVTRPSRDSSLLGFCCWSFLLHQPYYAAVDQNGFIYCTVQHGRTGLPHYWTDCSYTRHASVVSVPVSPHCFSSSSCPSCDPPVKLLDNWISCNHILSIIRTRMAWVTFCGMWSQNLC